MDVKVIPECQSPQTQFVRSADVVLNPRDGLNQFLAWPEYLAIDETYKVAFANLRLRLTVDRCTKCRVFEATGEPLPASGLTEGRLHP